MSGSARYDNARYFYRPAGLRTIINIAARLNNKSRREIATGSRRRSQWVAQSPPLFPAAFKLARDIKSCLRRVSRGAEVSMCVTRELTFFFKRAPEIRIGVEKKTIFTLEVRMALINISTLAHATITSTAAESPPLVRSTPPPRVKNRSSLILSTTFSLFFFSVSLYLHMQSFRAKTTQVFNDASRDAAKNAANLSPPKQARSRHR